MSRLSSIFEAKYKCTHTCTHTNTSLYHYSIYIYRKCTHVRPNAHGISWKLSQLWVVCFYMASPPLRSSSNRETQAMRSTWFARVKRGSSCRPTRARTRRDRSFSGQDMMGAIMVESRYVSEICGIKSGDLWSLGGKQPSTKQIEWNCTCKGMVFRERATGSHDYFMFFFPTTMGGLLQWHDLNFDDFKIF